MKKDYSGYFYILPATIFIFLFSIIPIGMSLFYSFNKFNIIQPMEWIGLDNYKNMFKDPYVIASLKNTIVYALIVVPTTTILSMMIAALITSRSRNIWNGFVKSTLFIPVISSMILVGTLWRIMYNPQVGLINQFLNIFHIDAINWLGSKKLALLSICVVGVWKNVGYFMVIYIAAILDIPRELYEAGRVDGASSIQQFWHITLPMLKPINFLVVILGTIWSFQVFDLVYTMTGGGPGTSTVTLVSTIYNAAFREYKMGYACAVAMMLFAIIIVISILQQQLLNKKEH
ncbi:MAG: sugar ABC transporter permease [Clostridiaceae bacterium]|nr:sugar ABC transporter permease [Clostridiaceae bacterium]